MRFFLATKKIYQMPNYNAYEQSLEDFKKELYPNQNASVTEKWDLIINKFISLMPENSEALNLFSNKRKNTIGGQFSIDLTSFLSFMENFYFLLENKNEDYQLNSIQKESLKDGIREILNDAICEPGIITRVNELITANRNDMQWISSELYKQRKNVIKIFADTYNAINHVSPSLTIHTNMAMNKLSQEYSLGAHDSIEIGDPYLSIGAGREINSFFKNNYVREFLNYQFSFQQGLKSHLLSIFKKEYEPKFSKNDENRIVFTDTFVNNEVIESENTKVLKGFLNKYLDGNNSLNYFLNEDESDYTTFFLQDINIALDEAFQRKLSNEGFVINFEDLNEDNIDSLFFLDIDEINTTLFKKFLLKIKNKESIDKELKTDIRKYLKLFELYPELLIGLISEGIITFALIPKEAHNHNFIKMLVQYSERLEDDGFIHLSKKILESNLAYLKFYSTDNKQKLIQSFKDELPVITLFENFDNFWRDYPKENISLFELKKYAPLIQVKHLEELSSQNIDGISKTSLEKFFTLLKNLKINTETDFITFKTEAQSKSFCNTKDFNLNQHYENVLLHLIVKHASLVDAFIDFQHHMPIYDLEFNHLNSMYKQLILCGELFYSWLKMCIEYLKKIINLLVFGCFYTLTCIITNEIALIIIDLISNYPLTVLSLTSILFLYNLYNFQKFFDIPQDDINIVYMFVVGLSLLLILFYRTDFIFLNTLLSICILLPTITSFGLKLLNISYTERDVKILILSFLKYYFSIEKIFQLKLLNFIDYTIENVLCDWPRIFGSIFYSWLLRSYETLNNIFFIPHDFQYSATKIEFSILRLQTMDDISAKQKGNLLAKLWDAAKAELRQNPDLSLTDALNKKFNITYKNTSYQLSFNELASIKRIHGKEFELSPKTSRFSWFSTSTSSGIKALDLSFKIKTA